MNKQQIRNDVAAALRSLENKEAKSADVCRKFLENEQVQKARTIALFVSTKAEPDTSSLFKALRKDGKRVYAPRVEGEDIVFVETTEKTEFRPGAFGISEPQGEPYSGSLDVIAVPLVAFDDNNNRLGHGKGYYDRFLKDKDAFTVGLAFSMQKRDVPLDPWDVPLSIIITD